MVCEGKTVAQKPSRFEHASPGRVLLRLVHGFAGQVELAKKILDQGMSIKIIANWCKFAQIVEEKLISRQALNRLRVPVS